MKVVSIVGAFALAGIALFYDVRDGLAENTHIGVIGASACPQRIPEAEAALMAYQWPGNVRELQKTVTSSC